MSTKNFSSFENLVNLFTSISNKLKTKVENASLKDTVGWVGKNDIPYPYKDKGDKTSATINFVDNGNGIITAKAGTATGGNAQYYIWGDSTDVQDISLIKEGMLFSKGIFHQDAVILIWYYDNSKTYISGQGATKDGTPLVFPAGTKYFAMVIRINSGTTLSEDLDFYPMLRDASITDGTFEPYHKPVEDYLDSIFDTDADDKPYVFRKGKGTLAKIKKLIGGSLAWNQLVQNGNFADTTIWGTTACSASMVNNKYTVTPTAIYFDIRQTSMPVTIPANHKVFVLIDAKITAFSSIKINFWEKNAWGSAGGVTFNNNTGVFQSILSLTLDTNRFYIGITQTDSSSVVVMNRAMIIDLTQMFGSTIADAIYALEQATAGAGVEWFKNYFPKAYYAYDAGSLQSVNVASRKVVGKNIFDTIKNQADVHTTVINGITFTVYRNAHGAIEKVIINGTATGNAGIDIINVYQVFRPKAGTYIHSRGERQSNNVEEYLDAYAGTNTRVKALANLQYTDSAKFNLDYDGYDRIRLGLYVMSGKTVNNEVVYPMLRYADVEDDTYEPYKEHIFDLDDSVQLRGIPKLVDNALQYDGDIYTPDGQITRKYGIIDLGDMNYGITTLGGHNSFRTFPQGLKNYGRLRHMQGICGKYVMADTAEDLTCCFYDTQFIIRDDSYNEDTSAFKTAMSGVYLVYELATPTTEMANSYQNPQKAIAEGNEEFIDAGSRDVSIPVGHETEYKKNVTYPSIEDYNDIRVDWKSNSILGAHNLAEPNKATNRTEGTASVVVNDDGSLTINKSTTASGDVWYIYMNKKFKKGRYVLNGCTGGSGSTFRLILRVRNAEDTEDDRSAYCSDGTDEIFVVPEDGRIVKIYVEIRKEAVLTNKVLYPMIRLASDPDTSFKRYSMTNKELTEKFVYDSSKGYAKIGNIVVLNCALTLTQALNTAWNTNHPDFAKFPKPAQNCMLMVYDGTGQSYEDFMLSASKDVFSPKSYAIGNNFYISGAYITTD